MFLASLTVTTMQKTEIVTVKIKNNKLKHSTGENHLTSRTAGQEKKCYETTRKQATKWLLSLLVNNTEYKWTKLSK